MKRTLLLIKNLYFLAIKLILKFIEFYASVLFFFAQ
jgi:hypothetical protein